MDGGWIFLLGMISFVVLIFVFLNLQMNGFFNKLNEKIKTWKKKN
jgi:hypothetical protein